MANFRTNKELWIRWVERIRWINSNDFSFPEAEQDKTQRIARAKKEYAFFVETYFPHLASKKCGTFQLDAADYLLKHDHTKALFEWARGHAKSTHLSLLIPLWLKIQTPAKLSVMVLVSKSENMAVRLLSDLQAELQYNGPFIKDFGNQVKTGSWTEGEFHTSDGCLFVALGRGQSPRGLKDRGKRPDYIVIDDIDDDELIRNPRRVSDVLEWALTALAGTMAMGRGRFVMVGNRIGKNSVLSRFAELPGIYHTIVNALNKKGLPSWSENYSADEIKKMRDFIGERRFQKEYMNNPINEGAVFQRKHILYGKMLDLKFYKSLICYTDPSFKNSTTADYKATVLVGKTATGEFHVLKAFVDQTSVTTMVSWHYLIMDYIAGRVPTLYYMEANFMQDLLLDEFKTVGNIVGHQIPIRGDQRSKPDKFARIEAMSPLFERALVWLNEKEKESPGMMALVDQLLMFEKGSKSHDDAPDALEGAVWLLSKRSRGADAPYRLGIRESRKY
jgi:predicted phage terminase large subunit-like protein